MALGIEPIPVWMVAPLGIRSATKRGDPVVDRRCAAVAATSTRGRSTSTQPRIWLTWSWLRPNVRGIRALASRKNLARPMNDAT